MSDPLKETLAKRFPTMQFRSIPQGSAPNKSRKSGPHIRPAKRECILLKQFSSTLLKSKDRDRLRSEGRIRDLNFTRTLSPGDVNAIIRQGFKKNLTECQAFKFLESRSGTLYEPAKQMYNGVSVIERRGALYLCEVG